MKSKYGLIAVLIIATVSTLIIKRTTKVHSPAIIRIGILQTASHPALDAAREGFVAVIKNELGQTAECIVHNAQGCIIAAHTIAEKYHSDDSIDAIYAIATPALQAIATLEKKKPIFIAAVTDPYALGLIEQKSNICGTTDMVNSIETVKAIKAISPTLQTIALIYNKAENNSLTQIDLLDKELKKNAIKTIHVGVTTEAEIPQAITSALAKADALLVPTDNLIAAAIPFVSHLALSYGKPLIACHNQAVEQGACMARGIDYYESGKQTGKIALNVLCHQKETYSVGIVPTTSDTITVNKDVLDTLQVTIEKISDTIKYVHTNK